MHEPARPPRLVRFDGLEVDLRGGELRRNGEKIKLQEQPLQILSMLLERPGETVTREEIRQRLWPTETFVEFDHSINAAVQRLRQALGDSAENPRFVETMARRGYRFIALLGEEQSPERRVLMAVLPFGNLSADPDQEYFSDGMTEEMITQLGRLDPERLGVIARTSAMHYKGTNKTIEEIGRELKVEYILEGTVRRAGKHVRISAQLIRVSDQTHQWVDSYDRRLRDVLALQSEVARTIAAKIRVAAGGPVAALAVPSGIKAEKAVGTDYTGAEGFVPPFPSTGQIEGQAPVPLSDSEETRWGWDGCSVQGPGHQPWSLRSFENPAGRAGKRPTGPRAFSNGSADSLGLGPSAHLHDSRHH